VFLIRSSSACAEEFVLSFLFSGKCLHYYITYTNDYNYCFETGPHFSGDVKDFFVVLQYLQIYCSMKFNFLNHICGTTLCSEKSPTHSFFHISMNDMSI